VGGRVLFGSLDNQVYAVRADNGHRLWALDVGERVSRPLALWHGTVEAEGEMREVDAVLVAPDDALALIALDVYDGTRLATFAVGTLPEGNAIVSAPLVASDGRVVVAHQGYAPEEAELLVLHLGPAPSPAPRPGSEATPPL
jgi:outer membrane protein assembly factor BamB